MRRRKGGGDEIERKGRVEKGNDVGGKQKGLKVRDMGERVGRRREERKG